MFKAILLALAACLQAHADDCTQPASTQEFVIRLGKIAAVIAKVHPQRLSQLHCIRRLGGCSNSHDAGVVDQTDIDLYDSRCRSETFYEGPGIELSELEPVCNIALGYLSQNKALFATLRTESGGNDAEALARMFTDPRLLDDGTVAGRMDAILEATQHGNIAAAHTGVEAGDEGFRGDREKNGKGFKDPHFNSRNQVGHFLTAVGLAYSPRRLEKKIAPTDLTLRSLLGVPASVKPEEVALRLIIGHEKAPDPEPNGIPTPTQYFGFKKQYELANEKDMNSFLRADEALGNGFIVNMDAAEAHLRKIEINPDWDGNSIQDLRLSLAGYHLGQKIRSGAFSSRHEIAEWIRKNLM